MLCCHRMLITIIYRVKYCFTKTTFDVKLYQFWYWHQPNTSSTQANLVVSTGRFSNFFFLSGDAMHTVIFYVILNNWKPANEFHFTFYGSLAGEQVRSGKHAFLGAREGQLVQDRGSVWFHKQSKSAFLCAGVQRLSWNRARMSHLASETADERETRPSCHNGVVTSRR
jgi:hypothetical protein